MLKNVAVDTGFGYGLMKSADKKVKSPSFIHKIKENEAKSFSTTITSDDVLSGEKIIIKIENKPDANGSIQAPEYYAVGEFVTKIKPEAKRFVTMKRVGDKKHLAQLLALVGIAVTVQQADINLCVGLPTVLRHYANDTEVWLKDTFKFSFLYNGGELDREINIKNVEVIGQAVAPILTLPDADLVKNILSIDLGHTTDDICLWQDGVMPQDYRINAHGFRKYYITMEEKLLDKYKDNAQAFSENRIQKAIETGQIHLRDSIENISTLQEEIFREYAEEKSELIATHYEDVLDIIDIILLSGGVVENDKCFFALEEATKHLNIKLVRPAEAQWNVVNGLYKRICFKYKDDFSK